MAAKKIEYGQEARAAILADTVKGTRGPRGGVAVIGVGAATAAELKGKKASVAGLLLTTEVVIAEDPEDGKTGAGFGSGDRS